MEKFINYEVHLNANSIPGAIIHIISQKFRGLKFYKNTATFKSNGYTLSSLVYPAWYEREKTLFVLGSDEQQPNIVAISGMDNVNGIMKTLDSYNEEMNKIYNPENCKEPNKIIEEKLIDYFSLHKETWLRITYATPPYEAKIKGEIVNQICEREEITIPCNFCFLCEYVKKTYLKLDLDCRKCPLKSCDLHAVWIYLISNKNFTEASKTAFAIAHVVDLIE